ncbi:hypothetical protein BC832DRAFT_589808 [Gaertneriomyces semiglobifer]|nr:hypothetical protein BC832DRAFT_589808 [Gaertneriomyces semiglobifer]
MLHERYLDNPHLQGPETISAKRLLGGIRETLESALQDALREICATYLPLQPHHVEASEDIYVGEAGAAFVLWRCARFLHATDGDARAALVKLCQRLTQVMHTERSWRHPAFICGSTGPLAMVALLSEDHRDRDIAMNRIERVGDSAIANPNEANELLYGRAGYLYTLLFIGKYMGLSEWKATWTRLVSQTIESIFSASETNSPPFLWSWHNKKYLGAAHGMTGIVLTMIDACLALKASQQHVHFDIDDILAQMRDCCRWIAVAILEANGNWPSSFGKPATGELVQWCHGPPGAALCLIRAYEVWNQQEFLDAALLAAEVVWKSGLLRKGVGLCHGIAGNAYVLLHLYTATSDVEHLRRACCFAQVATDWRDATRRGDLYAPDHPWSLFEGLGGAAMLWRDLLTLADGREDIGFPCFADSH